MLQSEENSEKQMHNFYWSFYELNNNKIYSLQYIEYFDKNKLVNSDFELSYTDKKLKNGNTFIYKFGQDFFQWFDNTPTINDIVNLINPSIKEEEFIIKKILFKIKRQRLKLLVFKVLNFTLIILKYF